MQRTFLSNLSLLMVLNLLVKPAYLLLAEAEVQNRVGSETFGHYTALLSLGFLLNIFLDLGINTFTTRELPRRSFAAGDFISGVVLLRLMLAAVYFVLLGGLAVLLGYGRESLLLLMWIGVNQLLAASVLYVRSNLSGLLLFRQDAVLSVLDRSLAFGALVVLLYGGVMTTEFDIRWLIGVQTAAYLAALITGIAFLLPHAGIVKLRWRPRLNRMVLNQSIPYALLVLLMMVYYRTDSVMLERMRDDGAWQAGVYAMGYRLFEASNMIGYLFATLLLPIFSRLLREGKNVHAIVDNAFRIVFTGSITIALVCAFWPSELLHLIYDNDIDAATPLFTLLMFAFVFMMLSYVWGTLLTAHGNMRTMNLIAASAVILNIGLNLWLIPAYGALGSAATSLATQVVVAVAQIILAARLAGVTPRLSLWATMLLYVCLLTGTGFAVKHTFDAPASQLLIFISVAIGAAFALRLVRTVSLKSLLRQDSGQGT